MEYETHTASSAPMGAEEATAGDTADTLAKGDAAPAEEAGSKAAAASPPEGGTTPAEEEGDEYRRLAEEDLAELTAAFPAAAGLASLTDLPDPRRYGELRELGLSPREAFLATGGMPARPPQDTRRHLGSSVGRTAAPAAGRPTAGEMAAARDLFPSLSDGEIEALYRRVEHPRRNP